MPPTFTGDIATLANPIKPQMDKITPMTCHQRDGSSESVRRTIHIPSNIQTIGIAKIKSPYCLTNSAKKENSSLGRLPYPAIFTIPETANTPPVTTHA